MDPSSEFPLDEGVIYLNHAAVSPWPRRTADAVAAFAEENCRRGSLGYPRWLQTEARLRERLRALVNAGSADDIALVKNTSEALSFVAYGLTWQPGDSIVITDQEFPSNRIVWESLASRGVEVRQAPISGVGDPEQSLLDCVDDSTRLIAVSSVQYATGLRMDLARIGRFCRGRGVLFCVDAIQSLGALTMDVQECCADFVAADGHKWMLGPEGLGLFYCRPEVRERLSLTQFGWHMVEHAGDYDRKAWRPAPGARRFECGSPNMMGVHALDASLSLIEEVGMPVVERALAERVERLFGGLSQIAGVTLLSDPRPERRSGIVTFAHREHEADRLQRRLAESGIFCAARGGGVRLSPHFYTPAEAIEKALERIAAG